MLMGNQIISPESEILNDSFFPNLQNMLMKLFELQENSKTEM